MRSDSELTTAIQVIEALGGTAAVAGLTGASYKAAANWKAFGHFPPRTFVVMSEALHSRGMRAPVQLWKMAEKAS